MEPQTKNYEECILNAQHERHTLIVAMCHSFGKKIAYFDIETSVSGVIENCCKSAKNGTIKIGEDEIAFLRVASRHAILKLIRRREHECPMCQEAIGWDALDQAEINFVNKDMIRVIFEQLPDNYREVMKLHHIDGYSIKEIAEMKERSVAAIYHLNERAQIMATEISAKLEKSPPSRTMPNTQILIRKINLIQWRISSRIWPYTVSAITY